MHQLTEPLRLIVLPCLPPSGLAALRGTCQAMQVLTDCDTGATWLAAASHLLSKAALGTLNSQSDAASVQAQLQAQAAIEAEIRAEGGQCGHVIMTHLLHGGPDAQVSRFEWSPCGSWLALQTIESESDIAAALHVLSAEDTGNPQNVDRQGPGTLAGIHCEAFFWLGLAHARLMVQYCSMHSRDTISIGVHCAATGERACGSPSDEHQLAWVLQLSPCKTLLAMKESCEAPVFPVWNFASSSCLQLQLPLIPAATGWSCCLWVPWSHDSSFCALSASWYEARQGFVSRLFIFTATGCLHQSLSVGSTQAYQWSPTQNLLAFVAEESFNLWNVTTATLISIPAALDWCWPPIDWSPDGKHLALACTRGWIGEYTSGEHRFNCIVSAAGRVCWTGRADIGCGRYFGLVQRYESRWSGNGSLCLGLADAGQTGVVLLQDQDTFTEVSTVSTMQSSASPCGRVIVSSTRFTTATRSLTCHNHFISQGSTDAGLQPHVIVSQTLPFKVLKDACCLAWHPSPRLSTVYTVLDVNSNVWIMDGRSCTTLHRWSWQDLAGAAVKTDIGKASYTTPRPSWSPSGQKLCVVRAAGLVAIRFGEPFSQRQDSAVHRAAFA